MSGSVTAPEGWNESFRICSRAASAISVLPYPTFTETYPPFGSIHVRPSESFTRIPSPSTMMTGSPCSAMSIQPRLCIHR